MSSDVSRPSHQSPDCAGHRVTVRVLAVAAVLCGGSPAEAQLSFSVAPIRVEHAIQPGDTKTDLIVVENTSDRLLRARVTIADWYLERDGAPVFVKRGELPTLSMSQWLEINPSEFQVGPGDLQTIRYTVTITNDDLQRSGNPVICGASGRWEIMQFRDAALVSGTKYDLSYLIRGRMGTDHNTGNHVAGDKFFVISNTMWAKDRHRAVFSGRRSCTHHHGSPTAIQTTRIQFRLLVECSNRRAHS